MFYIGIDVGGTGIKLGVTDESGRILSKSETPTLVGRPYQDIIRDMGQYILKTVAEIGLSPGDIQAVGVGIPGIANNENGHVIFCTNMHWTDVPLRMELQKYLDKPVYIDNDATVAGLAEHICGVSAGCRSSVFMTLGTGIGSGIILNGKPWSGFHGIGGELGHVPMDIDGELCTCGNHGCVERYCSAGAAIRIAKTQLFSHPESIMLAACGNDLDKLNAKIVFDAAKEGDIAAVNAVNQYVDNLCKAVYMIIAFLDPEMIVLGGGVSKAGSFLLNAIREKIPDYLLFKTMPYPRIEIAKLGADAGIIGAAMLGMLGNKPIQEA